MIYDNNLLMSSAQAITASAPSTNVLDLGATGTDFGHSVAIVRDVGRGAEIPLAVNVVATFNNLTSLQVSLQVADDSAFTTNVESIETGLAVPLAQLVAGYQFRVPNEIDQGAKRRWMRLYYTVVGTAPTTGAITAGIVAGRQTNMGVGGA